MDELLKELQELKELMLRPREIILPRHQYIPPEAISVDWRTNCLVEENTTLASPAVFINYKAKTNETIILTNYAIYTDAENANEVEFFVEVSGRKQLGDHGRPYPGSDGFDNKWKLNIGVSPDLSNAALIPCYIVIKPNDIFKVTGINLSTSLKKPMGVRFVGYKDSISSRPDRPLR